MRYLISLFHSSSLYIVGNGNRHFAAFDILDGGLHVTFYRATQCKRGICRRCVSVCRTPVLYQNG